MIRSTRIKYMQAVTMNTSAARSSHSRPVPSSRCPLDRSLCCLHDWPLPTTPAYRHFLLLAASTSASHGGTVEGRGAGGGGSQCRICNGEGCGGASRHSCTPQGRLKRAFYRATYYWWINDTRGTQECEDYGYMWQHCIPLHTYSALLGCSPLQHLPDCPKCVYQARQHGSALIDLGFVSRGEG